MQRRPIFYFDPPIPAVAADAFFVFNLWVMCHTVGLVCRTKPGRFPGDHKVPALGGRRLHLHSQHKAGEACGCFREDDSGSGEGLSKKLLL